MPSQHKEPCRVIASARVTVVFRLAVANNQGDGKFNYEFDVQAEVER